MIQRVKIYAYHVGMVFQNGKLVRVLQEGTHWMLGNFKVIQYNLAKDFVAPVELNILLEDPVLRQRLTVVEVADNQLMMHYENGNFRQLLQPGRYAYWNEIVEHRFEPLDVTEVRIPETLSRHLIKRREFIPYIQVSKVESAEVGLLFVNGQLTERLAAGTHYFWKNAHTIEVQKADLRKQQLEVSGQELLTKDKAALRVNFFTQYRIVDVDRALVENKLFQNQLYLQLQLALREYIGTLTLDELLATKEAVGKFVLQAVAEKAEQLGVEILTAGIRDVILPGEIKAIVNQVLVAEKQAQANTIMRREETASTRSLLNTAKLMENNEMLFKLKEMEYVEKIADKINSISVSGGGRIVEQLKEIFSVEK
ncbi:MAG: slipin family protein [Saprospiraceae bacterium]